MKQQCDFICETCTNNTGFDDLGMVICLEHFFNIKPKTECEKYSRRM